MHRSLLFTPASSRPDLLWTEVGTSMSNRFGASREPIPLSCGSTENSAGDGGNHDGVGVSTSSG
jgi:hypothetical protein